MYQDLIIVFPGVVVVLSTHNIPVVIMSAATLKPCYLYIPIAKTHAFFLIDPVGRKVSSLTLAKSAMTTEECGLAYGLWRDCLSVLVMAPMQFLFTLKTPKFTNKVSSSKQLSMKLQF